MNKNPTTKKALRKRRHRRIRSSVIGTAERPRLAVFRSNKFMSAQLIDDAKGATVASAHGREFGGSLKNQAEKVGEAIAKRGKEANVSAAVFDRAGFQFTGNVRALAEAARTGGLSF